MIYSKSCEYAVRALIYLTMLDEGQMATVREISRQEGLPTQFLSKLLPSLARVGIVRGAKGPGGGFALAAPPAHITLFDVVECIDGPQQFERCGVGLAECTDTTPCALHDRWTVLRDAIRRYLQSSTLLTMRSALEEKLALQEGDQEAIVESNPHAA